MSSAVDPQRFRVVALDVDGTITGPDRTVTPRTMATMRALAARGIEPLIVTGRRRGIALENARQVGSTRLCVSNNGAVITDPLSGEDVSITTMRPEQVATLLDIIDGHRLTPVIWTLASGRSPNDFEGRAMMEHVNGEPIVVGPLGPIPDDVVRVSVCGPAESLDAIMAEAAVRVPELDRAEPDVADMSPTGATKWDGLRRALGILGVDPGEVIGFGDGQTDAAWIAGIGLGIAMEEGRPEAKQAADQVIRSQPGDGVAAYVAKLFGLPWE